MKHRGSFCFDFLRKIKDLIFLNIEPLGQSYTCTAPRGWGNFEPWLDPVTRAGLCGLAAVTEGGHGSLGDTAIDFCETGDRNFGRRRREVMRKGDGVDRSAVGRGEVAPSSRTG